MEPSPSESSDSDADGAKDLEATLESSLLMQSLLDPSSSTFLDRPLPDCIFSDEEADKQQQQQLMQTGGLHESGDVPSRPARPAASVCKETGEGIKLRLKLDKSESVNYVAFVNVAQKAATTTTSTTTPVTSATTPPSLVASSSSLDAPASSGSGGSSPAAEPRVPPLHISLKGRNLAVLHSPKKDKEVKKKKSRSRHESAEEDDFHRGANLIPPLVFYLQFHFILRN